MTAVKNVDGTPEGLQLFSWEQVARALFKAHGIKSGLWRIGCQISFGATTSAWDAEGQQTRVFPTGLVGIGNIGLNPVTEPGELVFDASEEPAPNTKPKKRVGAAKASRA